MSASQGVTITGRQLDVLAAALIAPTATRADARARWRVLDSGTLEVSLHEDAGDVGYRTRFWYIAPDGTEDGEEDAGC